MLNRRKLVAGAIGLPPLAMAMLAGCSSFGRGSGRAFGQEFPAQGATSRLNDIAEISRLQRSYGYYSDRGDWAAVAALFADDGQFAVGSGGTFVGPRRIAAYLRHLNRGIDGLRQGQLNETIVLQPVIALSTDGNSAQGRWRILGLRGDFGQSASWFEGTIHADYVHSDGVWKIARQWIEERLAVPYRGGWGSNPLDTLATSLDPAFPPDNAAPPVSRPPALPAPMLAPMQDAADNSPSQLVSRLAAAVDVENLIGHFGYLTDIKAWGELTALFAADAFVDYGPRGGYRGQARIRQMFGLFGPPGLPKDQIANRMQAQPVIHVSQDGRTAIARTRSIMQISAGEMSLFGDSINEFRLSRAEAGWEIDSLAIWPTFLSDANQGIIQGILPMPGTSDDLPPDTPPVMTGDDPLAAFMPPFHYPHPVTGAPMAQITHSYTTGSLPDWQSGDAAVEDQEQLADLQALAVLQRTYGYLVDKALWRDTADLFAEDGTLEIGGRGVFVGRDRVYEYFRFLGPEGPLAGRLINHLQLQPIFTISPDGQRALGRMRFVAEGGDRRSIAQRETDSVGVPADSVSYLGMGIYENEYVKQGGIWKIAKMHAYFRMYSFDDQGWANHAMALTRPEPTLPPDRQPSTSYTIYPDTFIPQLHFRHPVTGAP